MAQIIIDIPDAAAVRIRDAFCAEFGYQATIANSDGSTSANPQTKAAFTKQQIANQVKQVIRNYESNQAAATARKAKEDEVNALNIA